MPSKKGRGAGEAYTKKQGRMADHIAQGYEQAGKSKAEAERIAWSTVNAQDGGGKRTGSGRKSSKKS